MTLFHTLLYLLGVWTWPPPPSVLDIDLDGDGYQGTADCSPLNSEGDVLWCRDNDGDGDGLWADGSACLPATAQPIDSRLVLSCG